MWLLSISVARCLGLYVGMLLPVGSAEPLEIATIETDMVRLWSDYDGYLTESRNDTSDRPVTWAELRALYLQDALASRRPEVDARLALDAGETRLLSLPVMGERRPLIGVACDEAVVRRVPARLPGALIPDALLTDSDFGDAELDAAFEYARRYNAALLASEDHPLSGICGPVAERADWSWFENSCAYREWGDPTSIWYLPDSFHALMRDLILE